MDIKTLENISIAEITATFNEAFQGYFIPLQFTNESMAAKIKSEGIQLHYSIGAFEDDRLIGFILHGYDLIDGVKTIYNAGTGVIALFRGKHITQAMYEFAIPLLAKEGIRHHLLEVIDNNLRAFKVYEKMGFQVVRNLRAFKCTQSIEAMSDVIIKNIDAVPEEIFSFIDSSAAWQNTLASIERDREAHTLLAAYDHDKLVGFAAYVASTGRVKQCAVHPQHRRKGIGKALFHLMMENTTKKELVATNVDESYLPAVRFLEALHFQNLLGLYEMKLVVE